jgi:hypothetical protein
MRWNAIDRHIAFASAILCTAAALTRAEEHAPPKEQVAASNTQKPSVPASEDDLFEFLGTVDMDDAALAEYLARQGARAPKPPARSAPADPDKKP